MLGRSDRLGDKEKLVPRYKTCSVDEHFLKCLDGRIQGYISYK